MSTIINTQTFTNNINFTAPSFINSAQTSVNGSISGNILVTMPEQGTAYKKIVIYSNLLNGSATYTFPIAFTYNPEVLVSSSLTFFSVSSLSTTSVTVNSTAAQSGFVILEGF